MGRGRPAAGFKKELSIKKISKRSVMHVWIWQKHILILQKNSSSNLKRIFILLQANIYLGQKRKRNKF
ncbi:MAG: hypothetical protein K2N73_07360 [Lachnospiraceae bacterium]|nr:hypothetical protein [Lachnospiraceae bacterium]